MLPCLLGVSMYDFPWLWSLIRPVQLAHMCMICPSTCLFIHIYVPLVCPFISVHSPICLCVLVYAHHPSHSCVFVPIIHAPPILLYSNISMLEMVSMMVSFSLIRVQFNFYSVLSKLTCIVWLVILWHRHRAAIHITRSIRGESRSIFFENLASPFILFRKGFSDFVDAENICRSS